MPEPNTPQRPTKKRPATSPLEDKRTPLQCTRDALQEAEATYAVILSKQAKLEQDLKNEATRVDVLRKELVAQLELELETERKMAIEGRAVLAKLERLKTEFGWEDRRGKTAKNMERWNARASLPPSFGEGGFGFGFGCGGVLTSQSKISPGGSASSIGTGTSTGTFGTPSTPSSGALFGSNASTSTNTSSGTGTSQSPTDSSAAPSTGRVKTPTPSGNPNPRST